MFMPGQKYTTKTTLAKNLGWPVGMVEELLKQADYLMRNERPGGHDMQMYRIEDALLFQDCPEVAWRKTRKIRRRLTASATDLEQWKAGNIPDMRHTTAWCLQQVEAGQHQQALDVARQLDGAHLDVFYGMARGQLPAHHLRGLTRLPQWGEPALRRHLVRALRQRKEIEALALGRRPEIALSDNAGHVDRAFQTVSVSAASRISRLFVWTPSQEELVTRMAVREIRGQRFWALKYLPGHVIPAKNLDRCLLGFVEKTRRDMGQNNGMELLRWARGLWSDPVILENLSKIADRLQGGPQTRTVSNFTKLFEALAKDMTAFDASHIKQIKREVGKDDTLRADRFRSMVIRKQLQEKTEEAGSQRAPRPKM